MRITPILAAVAALLTTGAANADIIQIDDFNAPYVYFYDENPAAGATSFAFDLSPPSVSAGQTTNTGAGNIATTRTLYQDWFNASAAAAGETQNGGAANIGIGGSPNSPTGKLNIINGPENNSVATVNWTFAAGALAAALAGQTEVKLFVDVVYSDTGVPPIDTRVDFAVGANSLPAIFVAQQNSNAGTVRYESAVLTATQLAALLAPGATLTMGISGQTAFDISFDTVGLVIPEPATLALAGLALVGAGVAASRRRKA